MLNGQIALITGASRGIGQAIALELGKLGATIIGTATRAEGAESVSQYLAENGFKGEGLALDVCQQEQINAALAHTEKRYGAPSILVNNAGITRDNLSMRMKDDEWNEVLATNLSAVFHLSKAVMRGMMKARYGRIINITSVVAHAGNAGQANYCAAKAGVSGMTRALAKELGSRNVTVNCVAPGFIETDMTRKLEEKQRESFVANIPLGRFGQVEDVAHAVSFLASPQASYITGATLHVNGGLYLD